MAHAKFTECAHAHCADACFALQLVEPEDIPRVGQIRDANRTTLSCAVKEAGYDPIDLGIAADT